jgi:hypothetical protein
MCACDPFRKALAGGGIAPLDQGHSIRIVHNEECGRGESNPHSLSANRFSYPPRLSPPPKAFGVWTIPSPWPEGFRCRPSSLYTFPARGLARDCRRPDRYGFPEFERFYSLSFPKGTPSKSAASTSFATPACRRSSRFRSVGQVMAQQFQIRLKLSRDCVPRGMKIIVPPPTAL